MVLHVLDYQDVFTVILILQVHLSIVLHLTGYLKVVSDSSVKVEFLLTLRYLVQETSGNLVAIQLPTSVSLDLAMVYSDSIVNLRLELVLVYLVKDLSQFSVALQTLLHSILTKKISYSLSMEKDHSPSIPTGSVVVFYSLYKLQLKELYMITLVLVDSLDSTILRKSRFTVTTVVPLYHLPNQIMDLLLIQMQSPVLMLTVLFLQIPHLQLDVSRYSIR